MFTATSTMKTGPIRPAGNFKRKRGAFSSGPFARKTKSLTSLRARKIVHIVGSANVTNSTFDTAEIKPQHTLQAIFAHQGLPSTSYSYEKAPELFATLPSSNATNDWTMDILDALRRGDLESLRHYHNEGRNLQCQNKFGETLLHIACRKGMTKIVAFLMHEVGMPLNIHDDTGRTPLHDAFWTPEPNHALIDQLLGSTAGENNGLALELLFVQDRRGHCPLDYARRVHAPAWNQYLHSRAQLFRCPRLYARSHLVQVADLSLKTIG